MNKKDDGRKLWEFIDWKGKAKWKVEKHVDESEILNDFTAVFQSVKTKGHPIISYVIGVIDAYNTYVPLLDDPSRMEETETARHKIGTGVSIDGIPPCVAEIIPLSMKKVILELVKKVFLINTLMSGPTKSYILLRKMVIRLLTPSCVELQ